MTQLSKLLLEAAVTPATPLTSPTLAIGGRRLDVDTLARSPCAADRWMAQRARALIASGAVKRKRAA